MRWVNCVFTRLLCILVLVAPMVGGVHAQEDTTEIVIDGTLHNFGEILRLLEQSYRVYNLMVVDPDSLSTDTTQPEVIDDGLYVDSLGRPVHYTISDTALVILAMGEGAFEAKDYAAARSYYRETAELQPQYYQMITWIGDTFFNEGEYDSAAVYFKRALEVNPIDYDAAWFLADVYWHQGDTASALRFYTRAHLLNVHHELLAERYRERREQAGDPWEDWSFDPRFEMGEDSTGVDVRAGGLDWLGYSMVKALWAYEPNYREKMSVDCVSDFAVRMREEKEALVAYMAGDDPDERLGRIIEEGFAEAFVCYEILAKQNPALLLVINREGFDQLMEYVTRFH